MTAKAETDHPATEGTGDVVPVEVLPDAGSVNALRLVIGAGAVLAVGMTYAQHPQAVQLVVGVVVTVVAVALAWIVASLVRDNRPARTFRAFRPPRSRKFRREAPASHSLEWAGPASREQVEAVSWSSLNGSLPAAVVLWETFKGTARRRKLRRAIAGQTPAPMPRRSGRRTGGGRR